LERKPGGGKMATLLSATGYGCTGSSAATNILEEFEGVKSLGSEEFTFAHEADGIADLEDSLREGHRLKVDLAVKRFLALSRKFAVTDQYKKHFNGKFEVLANEYIDSIIKCKWNGWWHGAFELEKISAAENFKFRLAEGLFNWRLQSFEYAAYEPDGWRPNYKPVITTYYGNIFYEDDEAEFLKHTRLFTDKLLGQVDMNDEFKYVLLDQVTPPISSFKYARYFTNPKTIIIDRDPRDLYALNKALWGVGFIPGATVEQFIDWYAATRSMREKELLHTDVLLFLKFEALIYEYDASLDAIYDFVHLSADKHIHKLKYFNPDLSKKNTRIFSQYPELFHDIDKIEKCLGKYCYAFPTEQQCAAKKHFLIQTINNEVEETQFSGLLPQKHWKYTLYILYRITYFYTELSFFLKEVKNRKGIRLLKLLIKSSVKISLSFIILPLNMLVNCFLFVKTCPMLSGGASILNLADRRAEKR
jgi:hypothetical protein